MLAFVGVAGYVKTQAALVAIFYIRKLVSHFHSRTTSMGYISMKQQLIVFQINNKQPFLRGRKAEIYYRKNVWILQLTVCSKILVTLNGIIESLFRQA